MWQAYKFKYENDEVISVNIEVDNLNEILLISKKGMAIRFQGESVNTMGRVASGVTGISLKEDDEVISGKIIKRVSSESSEIAIDVDNSEGFVLSTKNREEKVVLIRDIRVQNRAGRGTNIMLVNFDDEITEIRFA